VRQVAAAGCLQLTTILVLVHQQPAICILEHAQRVLVRVEQAQGKGQHGRVVHGRTRFQPALVGGTEAGEHVAVEHSRIHWWHAPGAGVLQPIALHGAVELCK
jgi:hypothetical protein